ncbi:cytochrome c [Oligoflexia bacterium]|nr:cytochrome c [Oligoflexia bacterium]
MCFRDRLTKGYSWRKRSVFAVTVLCGLLLTVPQFAFGSPDDSGASRKSIRDAKRQVRVAGKTSNKFCKIYRKLFLEEISKKKFKRKIKAINKRCKRSLASNKKSCGRDSDKDKLSSLLESHHSTNPASSDSDGDSLLDPEEVCVYESDPNNADSDGDGITDDEDDDVVGPGGGGGGGNGNWKPQPGFCDPDGNAGSGSFGIPADITGNNLSGQTVYDTSCTSCHPAASGYKGANLAYSAILASLGLPFMSSVSALADDKQAVANLTVFLNDCPVETPPPGGGGGGNGGTPTPTPTLTPTVAPAGPACSSIASFTTSSAAGLAVYNNSCKSCHASGSKGQGLTHAQISTAIVSGTGGMNVSLSTQQRADLVAYLNNCGGGPTPTPTPIQTPTPTPTPGSSSQACSSIASYTTSFAAGQTVYSNSCSSCHASGSKGQGLTHAQISAAIISGTGGMNINLSAQQRADLVQYLNNCSGSGPTPTPTPATPEARGRAVYLNYCSSCHNKNIAKEKTSEVLEAYQEEDDMIGLTPPSAPELADLKAYGDCLENHNC